MRTTAVRSKGQVAILVMLPGVLLLLACSACGSRSSVSLAPFKKAARAGMCADVRNSLFLIDDRLVFWDRAGQCSDAAYADTLFGSTTDQVLCVFHDSIAGPVKTCKDQAYEDMFNTITANLDKPDLGLGPEHTVQRVPF
jgi:hypothetical protein